MILPKQIPPATARVISPSGEEYLLNAEEYTDFCCRLVIHKEYGWKVAQSDGELVEISLDNMYYIQPSDIITNDYMDRLLTIRSYYYAKNKYAETMKSAGIAPIIMGEIKDLIRSNFSVNAVHLLRLHSNMSLSDAHMYIKAIKSEMESGASAP